MTMTHLDIAWYFATIRWLPLFLFVSIGIADLVAQAGRSEPVHWVFLAICITFGLLLFRVGCILMDCQSATQPKSIPVEGKK
ncbi:hypothetical protein [Thiothrix unzii]|uniref:Uncharacterized protein n=1 Tax=Thiothrix unzii TaxID=111769 RepID=A0A975FDM6_9GAMM|nr:hypothetical protein [Thiothrix unzii]QTR55425.1 hypothetical protein J9260_18230 [Thiothrix unzii]